MEKQGSIVYDMDRQNKVIEIFIISLGWNRGEKFDPHQNAEFSGRQSEIWLAELTNHGAGTNWEMKNPCYSSAFTGHSYDPRSV